jgi:hypothetical protein
MLQHPKQKKITLQRIATPVIRESQLRDTAYGKIHCCCSLQATEKFIVAAFYSLRKNSLLLLFGLAQGFSPAKNSANTRGF